MTGAEGRMCQGEGQRVRVSIIIPVKADNANLRQCVEECLALDYPDFEILVLPDHPIHELDDPGVKCIPTGSVGPAEKRNEGMRHSDAALLAFIDDDAYPARNWLKNAVRHFDDEQIAAVGGPAVTAEHDGLRQKAGGLVYSSLMGGGSYRYRCVPQRQREVDDYPSCNLVVRRSVMERVGGFQTSFWPGEDTALCVDITKHLGKKIMYDPEVLIYHHRRPLFLLHLKRRDFSFSSHSPGPMILELLLPALSRNSSLDNRKKLRESKLLTDSQFMRVKYMYAISAGEWLRCLT